MKRLVLTAAILALCGAISQAASDYNTVVISSWTVPPTQVIGTNSARRGLTIYNNGGQAVYCGFNVSVTTMTGIPIQTAVAYETAADDEAWRGDVYCKAAAGSSGVDIRYWWWSR